jgi:hypothetical protein
VVQIWILESRLAHAKRELEKMNEKNLCAHFGSTSTQTEISSIQVNVQRLKRYEKLQVQKTELEGQGKGQLDPVVMNTITKLANHRLEALIL